VNRATTTEYLGNVCTTWSEDLSTQQRTHLYKHVLLPLIGLYQPCHFRRTVKNHEVRAPVDGIDDLLRCRGMRDVTNDALYSGDIVDWDYIDRNNCRLEVRTLVLKSPLNDITRQDRPAARRSTQIDN
jgi:hypothetical protein